MIVYVWFIMASDCWEIIFDNSFGGIFLLILLFTGFLVFNGLNELCIFFIDGLLAGSFKQLLSLSELLNLFVYLI